ncbi:electron transfer flavoprotein subunit beta/FixA family protein [Clostridiales bacterium COT073_COT-073]|nr:electron transfer flavoprotein subunit beta/FixA family protein [Clostridiales bacterium COT073_COT-073]
MNILVCIKQVPNTMEIKIDPIKNTLIRAGVPSIVNPFDAYALEVAARIKDSKPDTIITVLSMGPEQAKQALKECMAVGADKAFLVSDRAFGGADTLATSYTLAATIRKLEQEEGPFDVIFCGKQAIDGDTAQVGPEIAEHLGIPQITYAIEATMAEDEVIVKRETNEGFEVVAVKIPCLITVTKPQFEPRFPTIKSKLKANRTEIPVIACSDISVDVNLIGLKGSPTKVKKTFTPPQKKGGIIIAEATNLESTEKLYKLLNDANII